MRPSVPVPADLPQQVAGALAEDIGTGDLTAALIPADRTGRASVITRESAIACGVPYVEAAFAQVDARARIKWHIAEGDSIAAGQLLFEVEGSARSLLTTERTALNFLQRLSGIATRARRFVAAAGGRITILDTRKTTPTLRGLEKYAVRAGGASNHRAGLFDAILIKDNHVRLAGGVRAAVARARAHCPDLPVEIEAETLAQVEEALAAGAETILVDNMSTERIRDAVALARHRAKIEISGGVTLERIPELAATGADAVSVGALTHSAPAIDISFEIEPA